MEEDAANPFSFFSFKEKGPPTQEVRAEPKKPTAPKPKPKPAGAAPAAPLDPSFLEENPFSFFNEKRPGDGPAGPVPPLRTNGPPGDGPAGPVPPLRTNGPSSVAREARLPTPLPMPAQNIFAASPLPTPVPVSDLADDSSASDDSDRRRRRGSPGGLPPVGSLPAVDGGPTPPGDANDSRATADLRKRYEECKERARVAEGKLEKTMKILRQRDAAHAEERRVWETGDTAASQQTIAALRAEVARLQTKEKEDERVMHEYMDKIERKLQEVTQRAVAAEGQVARLQTELQEQGPALAELKKKAAFASQQLLKVADTAEKGMRQMFSGLEDLRMAASTLTTMERTSAAD